jgi:hypothetical protein
MIEDELRDSELKYSKTDIEDLTPRKAIDSLIKILRFM